MRFILPILAATTPLLASTSLHAQQDASSIQVGGFDVIPSLDVGLEFNDNVIRDNDQEIESWSSFIAPQLSASTSLGASDFSFAYRIENKRYFSSPNDNSTDHFFSAGTSVEFDIRHRLSANARFEDGHDDRGTAFSSGFGNNLSETDKFKRSSLDFVYSFGAPNADGRLNFTVELDNLDYDIETIQYLVRDRSVSTFGATFFYRVGAFIDATLDVSRSYVDYNFSVLPGASLNSSQDEYLVGLKWEATAKTSGFAKIGYQSKTFDSNLREDFDGFDWELGVSWEPVDYSEITFSTESQTSETNGEGDFIQADVYSLRWKHEWLERLNSTVQFNYNEQEYKGTVNSGLSLREDDNIQLLMSLNYKFRRWLNVELTYIHSERDSNRDFIDFDNNRFIINSIITL